MHVIDGAQGEGGGQILRTSLALSMCSGVPVRIENIRAGRAKPGLMRQHLTCVNAARAVSGAEVSGAAVGSCCLEFAPGKIRAGNYEFAIGTAGSTTLVFQTILPALLMADDVSTIDLEGGTHNHFAPSFDFLRLSFLPVLKKMGGDVSVEMGRYGFYPMGGGHWRAVVSPNWNLDALALSERGPVEKMEAVALSARVPGHVAERELARVQKKCAWPSSALVCERVDSLGPGNVLSLRVHSEHVTEVFDSVGRLGVPAERVAGEAIKAFKKYEATGAPVGPHLADQLLVLMAVGKGGVFRTTRPTLHTKTNMAVIEQLTGRRSKAVEVEGGVWEISIEP